MFETFSEALQYVRDINNLSIKDLASKLSISYQNTVDLSFNKYLPDDYTLQLIETKLNLPKDYFKNNTKENVKPKKFFKNNEAINSIINNKNNINRSKIKYTGTGRGKCCKCGTPIPNAPEFWIELGVKFQCSDCFGNELVITKDPCTKTSIIKSLKEQAKYK